MHYQTPQDFEDWWKEDYETRVKILLQVQSRLFPTCKK